jgi:tRNA isopentenyl-2-thiomethyl-A-37 hydroxylase MiaE
MRELPVPEVDAETRLAELKSLEAALVTAPDPQFRFHSGAPAAG